MILLGLAGRDVEGRLLEENVDCRRRYAHPHPYSRIAAFR